MNKRFITILYESEKEIDKNYEDVKTELASIPGYASIGGTSKESFDNSKDMISMLQECIAPVMKFHCDRRANCDSKTRKKLTPLFRAKLPHDAKRYFKINIQTIKRILQSMIDMIPEDRNDEDRKKADVLRLFRDRALQLIDFADDMIRRSTNRLLSLDTNNTNHSKESNADVRYAHYSDGMEIVLKNDPELFDIPYNTFSVTHSLVFLNYMAMYCTMFHYETYRYYYDSKDSNKEFDFFSAITQINKKMGEMAANNQQLNKKVDVVKENTSQLVKGNKQIVHQLDGIERKQTVSDDAFKRKSDKIIETVKKKNKESRWELTQMKCAEIIADQRNIVNHKKRDLLKALHMSTEKIDKEINKDEEKTKRNIARRIADWDTGKTRPPAGYSRRMSEKSFEDWATTRENNKFEAWRIKIQKNLKQERSDTMSEEELHARMEEDRENDDFRYFDEIKQ